LPEKLQKVLEPAFKTEVLYRSRSQDVQARLEKIVELQEELLALTSNLPEIQAKPEIKLVQRFIDEQTTYDPEQKKRIVKENKDIRPTPYNRPTTRTPPFARKGIKSRCTY